MILDKKICKKIEYHLYNHNEHNEELQLEIEDIIYGVQSGYQEGSRGNEISNKTEKSALKLVEKDQDEKTKWVSVVNSVIERFKGTEYEDIIQYTYKDQFKLQKILRLVNLRENAYYDRKNDIIMYTALKAVEKGLIKI